MYVCVNYFLSLKAVLHAHWVIVLHLGFEGCLQPRELWFSDTLMHVCVDFLLLYFCATYIVYYARDCSCRVTFTLYMYEPIESYCMNH